MENANLSDILFIVWFIGFIMTIAVVIFKDDGYGHLDYDMDDGDSILRLWISGLLVSSLWFLYWPIISILLLKKK